MSNQRIAIAPPGSRQQAGPDQATARPDGFGVRVKGRYPITDMVWYSNSEQPQPHWVTEPGGLWLSHGWGLGPTAPSGQYCGSTLWSLDADDNPVRVTQADIFVPADAPDDGDYFGEPSAGPRELIQSALLGDGLSTYCDIGGNDGRNWLRVWNLGGPSQGEYLFMRANYYSIQASRVVGSSIVKGPRYDFSMFNFTEPMETELPDGTHTFDNPDFVDNLGGAQIVGFREDHAMLVSSAEPLVPAGRHVSLWFVDPFDPVTTLKDPSYVRIARQADVVISFASMGIPEDGGLKRVMRRSATEAVFMFESEDVSFSPTRADVVRVSDSGAFLGRTTIPMETQQFATAVNTTFMGSDVVHSGDERISGSVRRIGLPYPTHSTGSFQPLTGQGVRWDDDRYLFTHLDLLEGKLEFIERRLDSDDRIATYRADPATAEGAEVVAMANHIIEGVLGNVDEKLWATSWGHEIRIIELGTAAVRGTGIPLALQGRIRRLPEGSK